LDRGKIVSAYECVITRGKSECECGKCDYHIKDSAVFFCDNQRVLTDALELLKEQETTSTTESRIFHCKKCGYGIDDIFLSNEHDFDIYPHFCPNCGRSVIE
jgi:ribosomal protein S27AE